MYFDPPSMTTYPLIMALHYFRSQPDTNPSLVTNAMDKLQRVTNSLLFFLTRGQGYQRLAGYECKGGGFEWFGSDPGHEGIPFIRVMT